MNLLPIKITLLVCLLPLFSFSQKKDVLIHTNEIKFDSVGKIVQKTVADSLKKNKIKEKKATDFHFFKDVFGKIDSTKRKKLPKIALYRSLIIPGWGQATNKQAWLVPIIYTTAYASSWGFNFGNVSFGFRPFNQKYVHYKGFLEESLKTENLTKGVQIDGSEAYYTSDRITPIVNFYRRNRDMTYIAFGLGWALQAVQANVQAHLRTFDISDDISLKFEPDFQITPYGSSVGLSAKFVIK